MKIKNLYLIVLFPLFVAKLSAQVEKVDSLIKTANSTSNIEDKVKSFTKIAKIYAYINPDSTQFYGNKALQLSIKNSYKAGECRALSIIGSSYFVKENDSIALSYYQQALDISRKHELGKDEAAILSNIGTVYINIKQFSKGAEFLEKALKIDRRINNSKGEAIRVNNLSTIYLMQGDYSRAAEYIFQSIAIFKKDGDNIGVAMAYNNLAKMYDDQKEYEKSIEYLKKAEKLLIKEEHSGLLKRVYSNWGDVCIKMDDNDNGIKYLRKAIYYGNLSEGPCTIQNSLLSLSKVFIALGKLDSVLISTNKVLKNGTKCKSDSSLLSEAYYLQSEVAIERGNWDEAEKRALAAYRVLTNPNRYKSARSSAAKLLAKVYAHKQDFKKAYLYKNIYHELQDSLINESNIKDITRLEAEHNFELEKQIIEAKNKEDALVLKNKVQQQKELRNLLIVLGGIAIVLMFIFYRVSLARKKANAELQEKNSLIVEQKEKIEEANNELIQLSEHKEFFTQMIAHDLKNPLNIINVFSSLEPTLQNQKHIKQASTQMFSLVNNMLDVRRFENKKLSIHKSNLNIGELISDAVTRSGLLLQTKSISVNTDENIKAIAVEGDKDLLIRVFENLITNAAKYSKSGTDITVTGVLNPEAKQVELKFTDKGFGIEKESIPLIFDKYWQVDAKSNTISASTGLGLAFCKLVIEAHEGRIAVESEINQGTTFIISLPNATTSKASTDIKKDKELNKDDILPEEYRENPEIIASFNTLKELKVFKVGSINTELEILSKYRINEVWKSKVLTAVYSGNQREYDKLMAMEL